MIFNGTNWWQSFMSKWVILGNFDVWAINAFIPFAFLTDPSIHGSQQIYKETVHTKKTTTTICFSQLPGGGWPCMPPGMLPCCDACPAIAFMFGDWASTRCWRIGFRFFPKDTAAIRLFVSACNEFCVGAVLVSGKGNSK